MSTFWMIITVAVLTLIASVVINSVVAAMSGDRADDARTTFVELLLRVLGGLELGIFGRVLHSLYEFRFVRWLICAVALFWLLRVVSDAWIHS